MRERVTAGQAQTETSRRSGKPCSASRRTVGTEERHGERHSADGDTGRGRSPTGWPGREVPGGRTRLSALCPLCSTWTWVLQEPQEMSPRPPVALSLAKLTRLNGPPRTHWAAQVLTSTMAILPMDGVSGRCLCGLRCLCSPNSHS